MYNNILRKVGNVYMSKTTNYKKYAIESLEQSTFVLIRTECLKQRLKHLKKKPHKNKIGIHRIKQEIRRRKEEEFNYLLEAELSKFEAEQSTNHYPISDAVRERIKEMKESLADTVASNPDFDLRLKTDSKKLKVLAEIKFKQEDNLDSVSSEKVFNIEGVPFNYEMDEDNTSEETKSTEIYGYIVQNISSERVHLYPYDNNIVELYPKQIKILKLEEFIRATSYPEFSFTLANGYVKLAIPLEEVIKQEEQTGQQIIITNYHFVSKSDIEPIPVVYMD